MTLTTSTRKLPAPLPRHRHADAARARRESHHSGERVITLYFAAGVWARTPRPSRAGVIPRRPRLRLGPAARRRQLPDATAFDGELVVRAAASRLAFERLQYRLARGGPGGTGVAGPLRRVRCLAAGRDGHDGWPYQRRRAALESMFAARRLIAPWVLCPSTSVLADTLRRHLPVRAPRNTAMMEAIIDFRPSWPPTSSASSLARQSAGLRSAADAGSAAT